MKEKKFVYLCGPTVYNKVHIGNMRPIVTFDIILRSMKYLDPNIKLIHNITDIDDKIIKQAQIENVDEKTISEKYYKYYLQMLELFNVKTIDIMPKVTDHIKEIEEFVNKLIDKKYAYELNGSIYFDTKKNKSYGSVSNIKLDKLKESNALEQKNSFDFALWKNKTEGINWKTSIGSGRPGWHTECAVFVSKYTNNNILEIHGGGIDLKFPHHENENAQYVAANDMNITKEWLHIGPINFNNQKMSKSIGNIVYADDFLNKYNDQINAADLFRLLIISSSYNSVIELNDDVVNSLIKKMIQIEKIINYILINEIKYNENKEYINNIACEISKFNFSHVYKELNYNIKKFNELKSNENALNVFALIKHLGFNLANKVIDINIKNVYNEWINEVKNKNFSKADELRKILIKNKII